MTEWAQLPTESQESVSPARFAQAIEQSLFLDGWDLKSAAIPTFLSQGKIVRLPGDDVATIQHGLQLGGQLFWSDLPWDIRRTLAPAQTLGLVGAMAGEVAPSDVGQRLQLPASSTGAERVFAYTHVDDEESIWESTVAMGVASDLRGCLLAAESRVEGSGARISVCASTTPNLIGLSSARTQVEVTSCAKTKDDCSRRVYLSRDGTLGGPGSVLRMEVSLQGPNTCAVLRAARNQPERPIPHLVAAGRATVRAGPAGLPRHRQERTRQHAQPGAVLSNQPQWPAHHFCRAFWASSVSDSSRVASSTTR